MEQLHQPPSHSWAEVDLNAIRQNVRAIKRHISSRHLWAVVKANAYGHGAEPVARAAIDAGADGLAVSCLGEAAELRMEVGIRAPLLVLGVGERQAAAWHVRLDLIQTVCMTEMLAALSGAAQQQKKPGRVHIKVDTGMGRLGVKPEDAAEFAAHAKAMPGLQVEGVFSHLATSEEEDTSFVREQFSRFGHVLEKIERKTGPLGMKHISNSAATLRFPEMLMDGVRVGLLIYGIKPVTKDMVINSPLALTPALTWKTRLAFIHKVPAGSTVSYGRSFRVTRETRVGVLPLGYADGYPRRASNRSKVLVAGTECPVIGTICMDQMMVDLTGFANVEVGQEVILLGKQGKAQITANDLAEWAETVAHEVPTLIGRRVKRVYLDRERSDMSDSNVEAVVK